MLLTFFATPSRRGGARSRILLTVLSWSRGLASLSPGVVPWRGLRPDEWRETHGRLCAFIDQCRVQAHEASWGTTHLFGVSPTLGTIRGDWTGHLLPLTRDVTEVTDEWIRIGNGRAYKAHPITQRGMIPIWEAKQ
ncbi:hypothetical protein [Methylobacterium terricola]|uniref:hypothetical protein n=1 Tax=Methylobacterium terricola TaxID=2583531 RepID=UPI00268E84AA